MTVISRWLSAHEPIFAVLYRAASLVLLVLILIQLRKIDDSIPYSPNLSVLEASVYRIEKTIKPAASFDDVVIPPRGSHYDGWPP